MLLFILVPYSGPQGPLCPGSKEAQWFPAELQHGHPCMVRNDEVSPTGPRIYNVMNASNTGRWTLIASFQLWGVHILSKEVSLPILHHGKGLWPLGTLLHTLGFQMASWDQESHKEREAWVPPAATQWQILLATTEDWGLTKIPPSSLFMYTTEILPPKPHVQHQVLLEVSLYKISLLSF